MSVESKVGRSFFDILESIKAQLAAELLASSLELNIPQEALRQLIQKTNAVVDKNYDRGAATLIKSL
nr:hypothetical protein [Rhodospirillales bacterium]